MIDALDPKLLIEMQENFGIGMGLEGVLPVEPELFTKLPEIGDLSVVRKPYIP